MFLVLRGWHVPGPKGWHVPGPKGVACSWS